MLKHCKEKYAFILCFIDEHKVSTDPIWLTNQTQGE